jgi:YD repeat-containing protein
MKKILYSTVILFLASFILFISSCSKVVVVDGHVATQTEVYTAPGTATTTITTFTYDQYGRQVQQIMAQTGVFDTTATTYNSYYSVSDTSRSNGVLSTVTYSLDAGLASHDNGGTGYAYDNNGYLTGQRSNASSFTINTISNGNITTSVLYQVGLDTVTTTNTYLTNRSYWNFGINFLGKPNQNLVSTGRQVTSQYGTLTTINATYTYTYDGHGRVKTENIAITGTGFSATDDFTYTYTTN